MDAQFDYQWAEQQLRGQPTREILCPDCSNARQAHNRKKPCLGLRWVKPGRITFKCQNCGAEGVLTDDWDPNRRTKRAAPSGAVIPMRKPDNREKNMARWASDIWVESVAPQGTLAEAYFRARFGSAPVPFPASLRFNPACHHEGVTQPAVVAAFGIAGKVVSIQRTMLKPDGTSHAGKFALGAHKGLPMVVLRNPESRGLVIAEGMEKALAAAFALGVEGWAAAGLHFLEDLAGVVPADCDCVTVIVDQGKQALEESTKLVLALRHRGIDFRAVRLPEDPDDILRTRGVDVLRAAIDAPGNVVNLQEIRPDPGPRLLWESDALKQRQPQDWLIEGILERGYLYSMTARSGSGKTSVALLLSYLIAAPDMAPRRLGAREVEPGTVIFLAGENPVDVIRRMAGLRGLYKLTETASFAMIQNTFSIKDTFGKIAAQIPKEKPLSLVIVDSAQAYFPGEEENSNTEMRAYAQTLRQLTHLPGNPAVLVLCHPAKFVAAQTDLLPRGGSSFLAEIDGNLTLWSDGEGDLVFDLHHTDKLRGPGFEKIQIELVRYTDESFTDTRGRPSYTIVGKVVTEAEAETKADEHSEREKAVLDALSFHKGGMRHRAICDVTSIPKGTVTKILQRLMARPPKVEKDGSAYKLVKNGKKVSDD